MESQTYECIKKLDTIYIPFREGDFDIKIDFPEEKEGFKNRRYIFNYKKKNEHSFFFEFKKNLDRTVEKKKINKSFLRKNKRKIVNIDALKKFDYQDIQCNLFNQLKIFYIIDLSEKTKTGVSLYRVIHLNYCKTIE
jgi:uncharacterized radical SAM superfamily Fe-S cluster-containing enzyme